VVIVNWVKTLQNPALVNTGITSSVVGLGCGILIVLSLAILLLLRYVTRGKRGY
jgi:hypothetical protein